MSSHKTVFAFAADTHVWNERISDELTEDLARIRDVDGIIIGGDVTISGTDHELTLYRRAIATASVPVYTVFGGHDGNELLKANQKDATANFRSFFGCPWYTFSIGQVRFLSYVTETHYLTEEQKAEQDRFLKEQAKMSRTDQPLVIVRHVPDESIVSLFRNSGLKAVLSGHFHMYDAYRIDEITMLRTPPLGMAGFAGFPRGYIKAVIEGDTFQYEYITLGDASASSGNKKTSFIETQHASTNLGSTHFTDIYGGKTKRIVKKSQTTDVCSVLWKKPLPGMSILCSPVLYEDVVATTGFDADSPKGRLAAMDATTGRTLWQKALPYPIFHTPSVHEGRIFSLLKDGSIVVFDIFTGEEIATIQEDASPERCVIHGFSIRDSSLFLRTNRRLICMDADDYSIRWQTEFVHEDWMGPCGFPYPDCERVFVPAMRGHGLSAYDQKTGRFLWQTQDRFAHTERMTGGIAVDESRNIVYATAYRVVNPTSVHESSSVGHMLAFDCKSGDLVWEKRVGAYNYTYPVTAHRRVLLGDTDTGALVSFDPTTGTQQTLLETGTPLTGLTAGKRDQPSLFSIPAVCDGRIVFAGADGVFYVLDAHTANPLGTLSLGCAIGSSPAVCHNRAYIRSIQGELYCLSI